MGRVAAEEGGRSQPTDRLQRHARWWGSTPTSAQKLSALATEPASVVVGLRVPSCSHPEQGLEKATRLLHMPTPKVSRAGSAHLVTSHLALQCLPLSSSYGPNKEVLLIW